MENEGYTEALRAIFKNGHGRVKLYNGTILSGFILDAQDPINDPLGVGYFTLKDPATGTCADVYADEFEELLETW